MFSALFIDLQRCNVRDVGGKKQKIKEKILKERKKSLNERPSCEVKLQNQ